MKSIVRVQNPLSDHQNFTDKPGPDCAIFMGLSRRMKMKTMSNQVQDDIVALPQVCCRTSFYGS